MKQIKWWILVLLPFFSSCTEEVINLNSEIKNFESIITPNHESIILAQAPECNTNPIDWDGLEVNLGSTFTFSLSGNFDSQTWTSSNENVIGFVSNSTSQNVSLIANQIGTATICVTANTNNTQGTCASCGLIRVVSEGSDNGSCTGPPPIPGAIVFDSFNAPQNGDFCTSTQANLLAVNPVPCATSYQWTVSPATSVNLNSTGNNRATISAFSSGTYTVTVRAVNSFGVSSSTSITLTAVNCGGGFGF